MNKRFVNRLLLALSLLIILTFNSCGGNVINTMLGADVVQKETSENKSGEVYTETQVNRNNKQEQNSMTHAVLTATTAKGDRAIKRVVAQTTNQKGNPTKSFIDSLRGFTLHIKNPWATYKPGSISYESLQYAKSMVENKYGVEIEEGGYYSGYNDDLIALLMSGKEDNTIYKIHNEYFTQALSCGYIASLNKAMDISGVDFNAEWYNKGICKLMNIGNNQYGWCGYDGEYTFPYVIVYNKSKIKNAKITDPYTHYSNGTWTWETLKEYAQKLTANNCSGLVATSKTEFLSVLAAASDDSLVKIRNGVPVVNLESDGVQKSVAKLKSMIKNNLIDFGDGEAWDYSKKQFASGNAAMMLSTHDSLNEMKNSSLKDTIGIVPFPKPDERGSKYISLISPNYIDFIPSACSNENRAKMLFLRDELYRYLYTLSDRDFNYVYGDYNLDSVSLELAYSLKYDDTKYPKKIMLYSLITPYLSENRISSGIDEIFEGYGSDEKEAKITKNIQKELNTFWKNRKFKYDFN